MVKFWHNVTKSHIQHLVTLSQSREFLNGWLAVVHWPLYIPICLAKYDTYTSQNVSLSISATFRNLFFSRIACTLNDIFGMNVNFARQRAHRPHKLLRSIWPACNFSLRLRLIFMTEIAFCKLFIWKSFKSCLFFI